MTNDKQNPNVKCQIQNLKLEILIRYINHLFKISQRSI